ncbi:aspartate aminotransferase [Bradyrhizobium sp. CCBAU 51745]|nr:aspartate aminotransferase [Bradyrhizobium sp. CCBAU 51745]
MAERKPLSMRKSLAGLRLERARAIPLHQQIAQYLRELILGGELSNGSLLAGSRVIASEIGCSRSVVNDALELLCAEGYLEAVDRSGFKVALEPPVCGHQPPSTRSPYRTTPRLRVDQFSNVWKLLLSEDYEINPMSPFSPGAPEIGSFPFDAWARIVRQTWRTPERQLLLAPAPQGVPRLRDAVADFLGSVRGLLCRPEEIVITSGTANSLDLLARMLLNPGDAVWLEEPGFSEARWACSAAGGQLVPVPVDESGLIVSEAIKRAPNARLAIVTPSNQYPLGMMLSLERRLQLLEWAYQQNAWIIEDDYNSEFRQPGNMIASLKSLDKTGRVIYVGTFSKIMFPSLRIGYLVANKVFADIFARGRARIDLHTSTHLQLALANFLRSGLLIRHVRRMRAVYAERHDAVVHEFRHQLADHLDIPTSGIGLHFVAFFTQSLAARISDIEAASRTRAAGVFVQALSQCYLTDPARQGFIVGFGQVQTEAASRLVGTIAACLARH